MTRDEEIAAYVAGIPAASSFWRLPIIRHVRALIWRKRMHRHYEFWRATTGALPVNAYLDEAVIDAIWRGQK